MCGRSFLYVFVRLLFCSFDTFWCLPYLIKGRGKRTGREKTIQLADFNAFPDDISQPPPAATPAPKLHSAHSTLTAVPYSITQVPKMQTGPLTVVPCTRTLQRYTAAARHPGSALASQLQSAHSNLTAAPWRSILQRHTTATPCNGGTSRPAPQRTHHLQRHQHASFIAHTAPWQQYPIASPKFPRCRQAL